MERPAEVVRPTAQHREAAAADGSCPEPEPEPKPKPTPLEPRQTTIAPTMNPSKQTHNMKKANLRSAHAARVVGDTRSGAHISRRLPEAPEGPPSAAAAAAATRARVARAARRARSITSSARPSRRARPPRVAVCATRAPGYDARQPLHNQAEVVSELARSRRRAGKVP